MSVTTSPPVGTLLRDWRQRRRLSQLDLALAAEVSSRHLSFLENGRAQPSRAMVLRLAERLDVPPRERNQLLAAAGFAPEFPASAYDAPALAAARQAVEMVLAAYAPAPALAVDRHWGLVAANRALAPLLTGLAPTLLVPPVNVLRASLHPGGLAPRIVNLAQWREHILARVRQQIAATGDPVLADLLAELSAYPAPAPEGRTPERDLYAAGVLIPFRLRTEHGVMSFFSTTTVFGTPVDITLAELAIEAFLPADEATARLLRDIDAAPAPPGEHAALKTR